MKKLQGLYVITDEKLLPPSVFSAGVEQALKGGAKIIQYRDKSDNQPKRLQQAQQIKKLCEQYQATFIVNDDVLLAKKVDADGVHLGLQDGAIIDARETLGKDKIIGVSCYNKIEIAQKAKQEGADYLAFGRFFSSRIKPNAVQASADILLQAKTLGLPVCAIGGIDQYNAGGLIAAGADMVAVISAVFADNNIQQSSRTLSQLFSS